MDNFVYIAQDNLKWIALGLFVFSFLLVLFNYFKFYVPAIRFKDSFTEKSIPVSVIICARNEEDNLRENLPFILNQDYKNYEVIVVNDCSTDDTESVLDMYIQQYPDRLRKVNIPESENYKHGKKMAVFIGIKHAKYEHLLFTDADCHPSSNQWIKIMSSHFEDGIEIVLGYGKYKEEKSFLNQLIRFDTLIIALQYLSSAIQKNPYMGVGRNMAYIKSLFYKNKGFSNHYHLDSGDDDLFINETATATNTAVCIHPDAFTISEPPYNFKQWLLQKARHFSTSPLYKPKHKALLSWIYFAYGLFYVSLFLFFILFPQLWLLGIGVLVLKYIVQTLIMYYASKKFQENKLYSVAFFLEPILLISYIYIALYKKIKHL